jgi:hypothetical protein
MQSLGRLYLADGGHDLPRAIPGTQPGYGGLVLGFDLPFHVYYLGYWVSTKPGQVQDR